MESIGLCLPTNTTLRKFCVLNGEAGEIKISLCQVCEIRNYSHKIYYNNKLQ